MRKLKRTACLLLAAIMLLVLCSACGGDTPGAQETETPEYVYVASYTPVDVDVSYVNSSCYSGGRLYFLAEILDGQITESYQAYDEYGNPMYDENGEPVMEEYTYDNYTTGLFSMAEDGSDTKRMEGFTLSEIPEGYDGYVGVDSMFAAADGGLWVRESVNIWYYMNSEGQIVDGNGNVIGDAPASAGARASATASDIAVALPESPSGSEELTYVDETSTYLHKLDPDGNKLATVDLSALGEGQEYFYINGVVVDGAGNIICYDSNGVVYALDEAGNLLFSESLSEENENLWIYDMTVMSDGSAAVLVNWYDETDQTNHFALRPVDVAGKAVGEALENSPDYSGSLIPGNGDYDFYYDNGTSLFGYKAASGESEKLLTWINCDVDSTSLNGIVPLQDGRVLGLSVERSGSSSTRTMQLVTMTPTPYSEVQQKTTLTYACMYLDYNVRRHILDFNRTNPTYRIEVLDYSEYNTSEDYNAGQLRLTTDILSGNVPDMIATDNLPIYQYSGKGLLEDLWPYIDADEELGGRAGVVEPLFNALSRNGKLYALYPDFYIMTMEGPTAVFGEEPGLTFERVSEAMAQYPDISAPIAEYTRDNMLQAICQLSLNNYVDWENGTCSFDQGFSEVLEFCSLFPETYNYDYSEDYVYVSPIEQIRNGDALLMPTQVYDMNYSHVNDELIEGGMTYVGFPGAGGNGSAFICDTGIAMSANCSDKEGAWQFMRRYVDGSFYDYNYNFSTNRAKFDAAMEEAMTPVYYTDENGQQVEASVYTYYIDDDNQVELYAMTQAEADKILDLISETTAVSVNADQQLLSIITEEAEAYFAGQRSAQDAAAMIQSRASIYVSEQS